MLLVEEDNPAREALSSLLRECAYASVAVSTGAEALHCLAAGVGFEILLCAQRLPDMTGLELLSKVQESDEGRTLAVVLLSSGDGVDLAEMTAALDAGACDYLSRPLVKHVVRNLWTHAWRKQRSAGGSGAGPGPQSTDGAGGGRSNGRSNGRSSSGGTTDAANKAVSPLAVCAGTASPPKPAPPSLAPGSAPPPAPPPAPSPNGVIKPRVSIGGGSAFSAFTRMSQQSLSASIGTRRVAQQSHSGGSSGGSEVAGDLSLIHI